MAYVCIFVIFEYFMRGSAIVFEARSIVTIVAPQSHDNVERSFILFASLLMRTSDLTVSIHSIPLPSLDTFGALGQICTSRYYSGDLFAIICLQTHFGVCLRGTCMFGFRRIPR